jgi:myosin heavy chain 6/7
MLVKVKTALSSQLDEQRKVANDEAKEHKSLLGKFRNAGHEVGGMKEHLDEELSAKENLLRQYNKAQGESDMWRLRFEKEGVARAEELEMSKLKMQACLSEAESTICQLNSKLSQLEKAKQKLQGELESMSV